MRKHLFDLIWFAENPTDSLYENLVMQFGEEQDREKRINKMARIVYGQIIRDLQPWWKHPRWHIHHWRLQIHPWQSFLRMFQKCATCGKHFLYGENWFKNSNGN